MTHQSLAVPGVTITVEGPNLQGALSAVTSENGDYIVPQLPPGTYPVSFVLSGFGRQQRTIAVAPTQTVPLNITLGLASLDETVNVVGKAAAVLTQAAQVATNFSQDLIAMLPTNRDINAVLLMAPAVHPSGPGGNYSIAHDAKVDKIVPTYEYVLGGPVRKDRLWFFTAGRFQNQQVSRNTIQATTGTSTRSASIGRPGRLPTRSGIWRIWRSSRTPTRWSAATPA